MEAFQRLYSANMLRKRFFIASIVRGVGPPLRIFLKGYC
jgi:hypothetical protein